MRRPAAAAAAARGRSNIGLGSAFVVARGYVIVLAGGSVGSPTRAPGNVDGFAFLGHESLKTKKCAGQECFTDKICP